MKRFGILITILSAGLLFTIACNAGPAGADDYKQQPAKPLPAPRFSDNSNGTVTDKLTGLIWLKDADCFGPRDLDTAGSLAGTLASGQCGLSDGSKAGQWRLPSRSELSELVNNQHANNVEWLKLQGFLKVQRGCYWSSTTSDHSVTQAWIVDMIFYRGTYMINVNAKYFVWPVRSVQ